MCSADAVKAARAGFDKQHKELLDVVQDLHRRVEPSCAALAEQAGLLDRTSGSLQQHMLRQGELVQAERTRRAEERKVEEAALAEVQRTCKAQVRLASGVAHSNVFMCVCVCVCVCL